MRVANEKKEVTNKKKEKHGDNNGNNLSRQARMI